MVEETFARVLVVVRGIGVGLGLWGRGWWCGWGRIKVVATVSVGGGG